MHEISAKLCAVSIHESHLMTENVYKSSKLAYEANQSHQQMIYHYADTYCFKN